MMLNHPTQDLRIGLVEPTFGCDLFDETHAHRGVIPGTGLSDVVKQGTHKQQIRSIHVPGVGHRLNRRLNEMSVNGIKVHRIVLGRTAHNRPLRNQPAPQILLIERLPNGHRGRSSTQKGH